MATEFCKDTGTTVESVSTRLVLWIFDKDKCIQVYNEIEVFTLKKQTWYFETSRDVSKRPVIGTNVEGSSSFNSLNIAK